MDMLIVTTESHRRLSESIFRPSLPVEADANVLERQLDLAGTGSYESASWQQGVTAKLGWALDHMATLPAGAAFVLSDVDIQFFPGFTTQALVELLDRSGMDVLFQNERATPDNVEVNTGFYVARNTDWFRQLLEEAVTLCAGLEVKNDQTAINQILRPADKDRHWGFLPTSYYARSQGFPPDRNIVLHHANFGGTIDEKIGALARGRKYVTGGPLDRAAALASEGLDYARTGKLRLLLREKINAHGGGPALRFVATTARRVTGR